MEYVLICHRLFVRINRSDEIRRSSLYFDTEKSTCQGTLNSKGLNIRDQAYF